MIQKVNRQGIIIMKHKLNISALSISMVCAFCAAASTNAYGASSVRSLGGSGTYTSAASAASATGTTKTSMRGGSVRVTPTSGTAKPVTSASGAGSVRALGPTSRLSIGKYLDTATSISGGGSSIRPNPNPGGGSSGGVDDSTAKELDAKIQDLHKDIENVSQALDGKQNMLNPRQDGFIIVDKEDIYIDTDSLADALIAMGVGGDLDFRVNSDGMLQWKQGDGQWVDLILVSEIGGGASVDLSNYSTTQQMNDAIAAAVSDIDADFGELDAKIDLKADKTYVDTAVAAGLQGKQDTLTFDAAPTSGSENMVTSGAIADAIAAAVLDGGVSLEGYATTQYVDDEINAVNADLATRVSVADAPKDGKEYVLSVVNGETLYLEVVTQ